jgi:hypothetical protein
VVGETDTVLSSAQAVRKDVFIAPTVHFAEKVATSVGIALLLRLMGI